MARFKFYTDDGKPSEYVTDGMSGEQVIVEAAVIAAIMAESQGHGWYEWPMFVDEAIEIYNMASDWDVSKMIEWRENVEE